MQIRSSIPRRIQFFLLDVSMRVVLFCCLVATSCKGQSGKPKPVWLEMQVDARAVAVRYPSGAPSSWLNALPANKGAMEPNDVFERSHLLVWPQGKPKKVLEELKESWSRESTGVKQDPGFKLVQVYKQGTTLLIPTGELLITFGDDVSLSEAINILKGEGLTIKTPPGKYTPQMYIASLVGDDGIRSIKIAKKLALNPRVRISEPNLVSTPTQ